MGRPINNNYIGNISQSGQQIEATAYFGGDSQTRTAYIAKQKGSNTYDMVDLTGQRAGRVQLVDGGTNLTPGQANIAVYPFGSSGSNATVSANLGVFGTSVAVAGTGNVTHFYVPGETLSLASGTASVAAQLKIEAVKLGNVAILGTGGHGYTVGDSFTWGYAGYDVPAVVTVSGTTGNGNVSSLTYTTAGSVSNVSRSESVV